MNLQQSFQDIGKIQVLLTPVGNLSYADLSHYYRVFQEISFMPIDHTVLSSETQNLISAFCSSFPCGQVIYNFHLSEPPCQGYFPMQVNRNISILLGIGESTQSIVQQYNELHQRAIGISSVQVWRMLVFNYIE